MTLSAWQTKAAAKRSANIAKIPTQWLLTPEVLLTAKWTPSLSGDFIESLLDERTREITCSSNESLLSSMEKGTLSALDVVTAFCKRAAYAHQLNNNLLEIHFIDAMKTATALDQHYKQHGQLRGPLHGLPYAMKDQWHIKGLDTTMSYIGWIHTQAGRPRGMGMEDMESQLVKDLSTLGAVPIAKTSMMQTTWDGETSNNILGYLWNPNAPNLSAGGSSGGAGALQSLRGSAFGFGTDIGGSVSMPAAANGVYSLKPSHGRLTMKDTVDSSEGKVLIPTVAGIFASSISDLRLVFTSLLATKPWLRDPEVLPIPFSSDHTIGKHTLAFGVCSWDGFVRPHPPIIRSLQSVTKALVRKGHEVLQWEPPNRIEAATLHSAIVLADGIPDIFTRTALSGEPFMPSLCVDNAKGIPEPKSIGAYYAAAQKLQQWRSQYAAYWNATELLTCTSRPIDAIIMPVSPHAAPRPGQRNYFGYSCIVNVLDYCSVVVPVSKVDQNLDIFDPSYEPISLEDSLVWKAYDPIIYHGAPTAIQVICRRLEEEKLLSIAQIVVDALGP